MKSKVDKVDIDKLVTVPVDLNKLNVDIDKLVTVPVDLNKLNDVVKNDVV